MAFWIMKSVFGLLFLCCSLDIILGECTDVAPEVSDASGNSTGSPPFPEGTAVRYECNAGFRERNEVTDIVCVNGEWTGKFGCAEIACTLVQPPENGNYVAPPNLNVGDSIIFSCESGFTMIGSNTIVCRTDGQWTPSFPPTCKRVSCGEVGSIEHASLSQESIGYPNEYGSTIDVTCDAGYILDGLSKISCRANGKWDDKPKCRTSPCGPHPALESSCLNYATLNTDGTLLQTICLPNSSNNSVTEIGRGTAFCFKGEWDELKMGCFCDCKVKADFSTVITTNLNSKKFLKHGSELQWKCGNGYTKNTTESLKCLDGKIGLPECIWRGVESITIEPPVYSFIYVTVIVLGLFLFVILIAVIYSCITGRKIFKRTAFIKEMIPLLKSSDHV